MKIFLFCILFLILLFRVISTSEANNQSTEQKDKNEIFINSVPEININLSTNINWYLLSLPFITIAIVICGTVITIKTINIRTEEAKNSFKESLDNQQLISNREIITKSRQEWINTLRDELAEFLSILHNIDIKLDAEKRNPVDKDLRHLLSKSELKAAKIKLLINPNEEDHQELVKLVEDATSNLGEDDDYLLKMNNKIISKSQDILKREWNRVKSLN